MIYLDLLIGFLKVGLFAFGGAYGAIPLIRDVVLAYGWLNDEMLTYMIAVSESTPGPIMVNLATYVGSSQAGFPGALIATAAVVLPSFIIILLIMVLLKKLLKNPYVQAILRGMKPCIIGIILATGLYMILHNCVDSSIQFGGELLNRHTSATYLFDRAFPRHDRSMLYASRCMVVRTLNHIFHTFVPFLQSIALRYFLLGIDARFVWDRLKYLVVFADSPILYTGLTDPIVFFYCVVIFHIFITTFNPNYCMGNLFPTFYFKERSVYVFAEAIPRRVFFDPSSVSRQSRPIPLVESYSR